MAVNLTTLSMQLNRYVLTSAICFGTIGSISNTVVFSRKNLRRLPCSLYYLTQSVICLFLLCTTIFLRCLAEGYQLDLPARSAYTCKFFLYMSSTLRSLSALFILWSSIDRYLASSSSDRLRQLSQMKYAIYTIFLTILTIALLFIYIPIYFGDSPALSLTCSPNGHGTLTSFHNILNAFILALFVPLMLIILSIMTFKNIQRRKQLVHTINPVARQHQNTHMIRLMLTQSFAYLMLVAPSAIFNLYWAFTSSQQNAQLLFTYKFLFVLQYTHSATAFYVNTLVSRTYRHELFKILKNMLRRVFRSTAGEQPMLPS